MSNLGGARPGAGRPKGVRTKNDARARRSKAAARKMLEQSGITEPFPGDAHALLMWVYKNPTMPIELRCRCANDALPYEKPRLSAIRLEVKRPEDMTDDELAAQLAVAEALSRGNGDSLQGFAASGAKETRH